MAKQNVGTPRFYIDNGLYQSQTGLWTPEADQLSLVQLNPANTVGKPANQIDLPRTTPIRYIAFLGHNGGSYYPAYQPDGDIENFQEIVNMTGYDETDEACSGFSMAIFDDRTDATSILGVITYADSTLGAVSIGNYYEMPVAPDLSLSLEHDYSGIKKTTSMSGASFSNANWIKPPKWGDREAWQLGDFPRPYSGRRIWDLSFSYISDTDLEPRNYTGTGTFENNLWEYGDDNWFENVLHYTIGGQLPFIFQPDKDIIYTATDTDITPDGIPDIINTIPEFAICRFDMGTFERDQVAPGVYNIKIKVKETW